MIYIFDLDSTLANIDHRRHLVTDGNNDWDSFYKSCIDDTPYRYIAYLFKELQSFSHTMVICSGRSDIVRNETEVWLSYHCLYYTKLLMRKDGDFTPDEELKRSWLHNNLNCNITKDIAGVFDDRDKVVKMWRDEGLTCFQVANGNF